MIGLKALKDLSKLVFIYGGVEQYNIIEKELKDYYDLKKECEEAKWYQEHKALEIIKKALCKKDNLELAYYDNDGNKSYYVRIYAQLDNDGEFFEEELTKEDYDLLTEVLTNEK